MLIIGHRGARGLAPENSLASFDAAIKNHVDVIEFDVRLTKDDKLVVIHDKHTKHIAFVKHHIRQLTLKEVQQLATRDGNPIPTLEQVLTHIKGKVAINIEMKDRGCAPILLKVLHSFLREKRFTYNQIFISSFILSELKSLSVLDPKLRLALLQRRFPLRFLAVPSSLKLYGVGFKHLIVTPWAIQLAKKRGLLTYAYTVNSPKQAATLQRWGLDGVCTDRPDILRRFS